MRLKELKINTRTMVLELDIMELNNRSVVISDTSLIPPTVSSIFQKRKKNF